jgi:PAS domain S-box-containing protein
MNTAQPSKILIIEDNAIDREVYKRCLWGSATPGFEFAEARCATEGIEMAAARGPDCALVDVNLPDMDGIEALARLKAGGGRIPFAAVVLTAYSEEAVAVRAMQAGAMDYLPKGRISAGTLPHVVRNAIDRFLLEQQIEEQRRALESSGQRYQVLLEAMPQMVWTANAAGQLEYANRRWFDYTGLSSLAEAGRLGWDRLVHAEDRERSWLAWKQAAESGSVFEIKHRLRRAADGSYRWHLVRALPMRNLSGGITNWFGTCTEVEDQKQTERVPRREAEARKPGPAGGRIGARFQQSAGRHSGRRQLCAGKAPPRASRAGTATRCRGGRRTGR